MSTLVVATQPGVEPVTLVEAKNFCRQEENDDDDLITGLIQAAREYAEIFTRRSFVQKSYIQYFDFFPWYENYQHVSPGHNYTRFASSEWNYSQMIKLWRPPCVAVQKIMYTDPSSAVQTLHAYDINTNPTGFQVDVATEPARLFPSPGGYWPPALYIPNAVAVYFTAGYSVDASLVPMTVKVAIKQLVSHWYEHRESVSEVRLDEAPMAVDMLLTSYRVQDFSPTRG